MEHLENENYGGSGKKTIKTILNFYLYQRRYRPSRLQVGLAVRVYGVSCDVYATGC